MKTSAQIHKACVYNFHITMIIQRLIIYSEIVALTHKQLIVALNT